MLLRGVSTIVILLSISAISANSPRHRHKKPRKNRQEDTSLLGSQTHTTIKRIDTYINANYTSYIYLSAQYASWSQATKECQTILGDSAHLLFIETEFKLQHLKRTLLQRKLTDQLFWVGGRFNTFHNHFEWADGTKFYDRVNWDYGYPDRNNIYTRVILWSENDLKFRTAPETKSALFLCELDLKNVKEK